MLPELVNKLPLVANSSHQLSLQLFRVEVFSLTENLEVMVGVLYLEDFGREFEEGIRESRT